MYERYRLTAFRYLYDYRIHSDCVRNINSNQTVRKKSVNRI